MHSIESDRMSILFQSQDQYQPTKPRLDVFPCTVQVSRTTWYRSQYVQDLHDFWSLGSMGKKNTLSSAHIFTSRYQSIVDNGVKIECASYVVDVMEYSTLNYYIVL